MSDLLKEISEKWNVEAKQEDNSRYFYHIEESAKILNGERFYVIGRKGSGKDEIIDEIHAQVTQLNGTPQLYGQFFANACV